MLNKADSSSNWGVDIPTKIQFDIAPLFEKYQKLFWNVGKLFHTYSTRYLHLQNFQSPVFPNGLKQIPTKYARSLQYTIDTISNVSPGKPFQHLRPEYSLIQPKDPIRLKALKFTSTYWHTVSLDLDMIEYISLPGKPWFCTNTKSVYFFSLNSHPSSQVAASSKKIRGAPWWLVSIYRG